MGQKACGRGHCGPHKRWPSLTAQANSLLPTFGTDSGSSLLDLPQANRTATLKPQGSGREEAVLGVLGGPKWVFR